MTTTTTTIIWSLLAFASSVSAFVPILHVPSTGSTTSSIQSFPVVPCLKPTEGPCMVRSVLFMTSVSDADADDADNNNDSDDESISYPIKIIISGAPASGKGTQCEIIKEQFGVVHLSTGDMLRAAVSARTKVGLAAQEYMDNGKLVPDEVIIGVVSFVEKKNQMEFIKHGPETFLIFQCHTNPHTYTLLGP